MNGLILSLALLNTPDAQLELANVYTTSGDYERSNAILDKVPANYMNYNQYHYCRSINYFKQNDKANAAKHLRYLADSFTPLQQRRQQALVSMMMFDIQNWGKDDLGDIGRDMGTIQDRLNLSNADGKTQKIQKEVVAKLDKFIKEQEDKANGGGDGKSGDGKTKPGQGSTLTPSGPAADSLVMGGEGKGLVTEKKLRQVAENWGSLPPMERAKVVQEVTRDIPAKYKPMVDEYFKALNRIHPVK